MPVIKVLSRLRVTCDTKGEPHENRTFDSQRIETSNDPSYKTNEAPQIKTDIADAHDDKIALPDYFRSSTNKAIYKRASEVLKKFIRNSMLFSQA